MYDLMVIKPKKNKIKVMMYSIIILCGLTTTSCGGIYLSQNKNKETANLYAIQVEEEAHILEKIAQEKILQRKKSQAPLTKEQLNSIINIYDSVNEKRVFLTFDDGPSNTVTPLILDVLKEKNIKATFFVLGNRVKSYPEIINRIYNEGHYIGNHGYSHKYSEIYSSIESALNEYNKTEELLREALNMPNYNTRIFRFPGGLAGGKYGETKQQIKDKLIENNIAYLNWNALTNDAGIKNATKETIMNYLALTSEGKNSIVLLMHDAADKILTYETLPSVIQFYTDKGYSFYNIYDIL